MSGSTATDPSARIQELEQQLVAARTEVEGSARLATLGMLVAGIAHELNTPLGALNSNHDVLRRSLDRLTGILADDRVDADELDELRRCARAIVSATRVNDLAVERMIGIVASLRLFGRPDRSERDRVDLREGIDSTLAILAHQLRERITVLREYGDVPPVHCHPAELNQVFMNLVLNAAQAIVGAGTITIRTRSDGESAVVEIQDDGPGIAPETLDRIFEPGFTTKGARVGMGIGLLICRQIVERHDGTISVESTVGVGTRFTVSVPVDGKA